MVRVIGFAVALGIPLCWANVLYIRWAPYLAAVAFPLVFLLYTLAVVWLVLVVGHLIAGYRLMVTDGICLFVTLACAVILFGGVVHGFAQ